MPRLGDHEPAARADDARASRARMTSSWRRSLAGPGELARARGRLDLVEARRRAPRPWRRPSGRRRRRPRRRARPPRRSSHPGRRLRGSRAGPRRAGSRSRVGRPVTRDPGVGPVAAVQVDDHRGQALERARARERAGVERAPADELAGKPERELLRRGVVAADECVLVRRGRVEVARGDRVQTGDDRARDERPGRARRASVASGSGRTPSRRERERARDREQRRRAERVRRASRAVSSAASAATASTARSTPATASSLTAPVDAAPSCARAGARARAPSREPITISSSPQRDQAPRRARRRSCRCPPRIATLTRAPPAASSTAWARRRRAAASLISVLVTTGCTPAGSSAGRPPRR